MFKKWFSASALLLALTLMIGGGLTVAQSDLEPKEIPFAFSMRWACKSPPCTLETVAVHWLEPKEAPDSYRLSWSATGRWRSIKKPNTKRAGNVIVTADSYRITGIQVPSGKALRIRVRARYNGEGNGPWYCCLKSGYGLDG